MASINSLNGAIDMEPRGLPVRRLLTALGTYWNAARDGIAAAHDYETLTRRGVAHEEAVKRVFAEHFDRR